MDGIAPVNRRRLLGMTGSCALVLASAVASTGETQAQGQTSTVIIGTWQEPSSLNPHLFGTGPFTGNFAYPIMEGLCQFDSNGLLAPRLALEVPSIENGDVSADGLTVTYRLRPDLKWSDGEPFTADDVVFTYEYLLNPAVPTVSNAKYRAALDSVEAADANTVRLSFKRLFAAWPLLFNGLEVILPRHIIGPESDPAQSEFNQHPIGTGAFKIESYTPGDQIRYVRNEHFREPGKPRLEGLVLKFMPSVEALVQAVKAGEVDVAWAIKENYIEELSGESNLTLVYGPTSLSDRILFNLTNPADPEVEGSTHPVLGDARVRRAIELAIDKRLIIDELMAGATPLASTVFSRPEWAAPTIPPPPFDPAQAASLLDEAGWTLNGDVRERNGVRAVLECMTIAGDELREQMQLVIRQYLGDIGIEVNINNVPGNVFWGSGANSGPGNSGTFDMAIYANGPEPDPQSYMATWSCAAIATSENNYAGNYNFSRYCNPEYDELLSQAAATLDSAMRQAVYQQMAELLEQDKPSCFLFERLAVHPVNNRISGAIFNPWTDITWDVENWQITDLASQQMLERNLRTDNARMR